MAISKALKQIQAQFKVAAPSGVDEGTDLVNNETFETILAEGKSYSQTVTMAKDATKEQINLFLNAVIELCAGPFELGQGTDMQGVPVITKKVISQHVLINE